jgi:hypothetical protein
MKIKFILNHHKTKKFILNHRLQYICVSRRLAARPNWVWLLSIRGPYGPSISFSPLALTQLIATYTILFLHTPPISEGKFFTHPPSNSRAPPISRAPPKFLAHPPNVLRPPNFFFPSSPNF